MVTSCLYEGWVRHRRFSPRSHTFRYRVFMLYLRLDELDSVFSLSRWWSKSRWALARFKPTDYFDGRQSDLESAVRKLVYEKINKPINGPICLLTNARYFGFLINPLSVYYCFDEQQKLQALLLEVTNTPWGERHHYVIDCDPASTLFRTQFDKNFHVSPFNPMDMVYYWQHTQPEARLHIHMENWSRVMNAKIMSEEHSDHSEKIFDATLQLTQKPMSKQNLNGMLWRYPAMTTKVFAGIYWQAVKLLFKRVPVFAHPKTKT